MNEYQCLDLVHSCLGTQGLDRVESMLLHRAEGRVLATQHPLHRPNLLHLPGLSARPWQDTSQWAWTADFEDATETVQAEFRAVEAAGAGVDSWSEYGDGWEAWALYRRGEWVEESTTIATTAAALIRQTDYTRGEFFFSELGPHGFIPFHTGGCNAVFSCHLPLIIAPESGIRVGTISRRWTLGKVLAFDDSYIHGCWNDSDERRIVLVWEVWHPELSALEREAMALVYDALVNAEDGALETS